MARPGSWCRWERRAPGSPVIPGGHQGPANLAELRGDQAERSGPDRAELTQRLPVTDPGLFPLMSREDSEQEQVHRRWGDDSDLASPLQGVIV